jgi:hypothetical protein
VGGDAKESVYKILSFFVVGWIEPLGEIQQYNLDGIVGFRQEALSNLQMNLNSIDIL